MRFQFFIMAGVRSERQGGLPEAAMANKQFPRKVCFKRRHFFDRQQKIWISGLVEYENVWPATMVTDCKFIVFIRRCPPWAPMTCMLVGTKNGIRIKIHKGRMIFTHLNLILYIMESNRISYPLKFKVGYNGYPPN